MNLLKARDALSDKIIRAKPDVRIQDVTCKANQRKATHCAVFDGLSGSFLGLVRIQDAILTSPFRILSDLIPRHQSPMIRDESALEEVASRFEEAECDALPVVDSEGKILGVVTKESVLQSIWHGDRERLRESVSKQTLMEKAHHRLSQIFERTVATSTNGILIIDQTHRVIVFNRSAERIFGCDASEVVGGPLTLFPSSVLSESTVVERELVLSRCDKSVFPAQMTIQPFKVEEDRYWTVAVEDLTFKKRIEAQLQQSQKLEVIGQLTGGITHDFNNLLMIILGYGEIIRTMANLPPNAAEHLKVLMETAEHGGRLVKQLLLFSRNQQFQPAKLNLSQVVEPMVKMLRPLFRKNIKICSALEPKMPDIYADRGMIEQVLLNVAINARDAMPNGGTLSIITKSAFIDGAYVERYREAVQGLAVCLEISDSGCGIAPENLSRVFDSFFTTKERGKGTGLGLATVYGIVKKHQGWITIDSELNAGTTVRVYFSASAGALESSEEPAAVPHDAGSVGEGSGVALRS